MVINETKPKSMSDVVKELPAMVQIRDDVHRWLEVNNVKYDYSLSEFDPDTVRGQEPRYFNKSGTFSIPKRLTSQTKLYVKISILKSGPYVQYEVASHVNDLDLKSTQKVKLVDFDEWTSYDYKSMFNRVISDFKKQSNYKETDVDKNDRNKSSNSKDKYKEFLERTNLNSKSNEEMLIDQINTEAEEHSIDIGAAHQIKSNLMSMIDEKYDEDNGTWFDKLVSEVKHGDYNFITVELSRFIK